MANYSYVEHLGDGTTTTFPFTFVGAGVGYLSRSDVHAYVSGSEVSFTFSGSNQITITPAPASGALVRIRRIMPKGAPYADFSRGNTFSQDLLNNSFLQMLYVYHEFLDGFLEESPFKLQGDLEVLGRLSATDLFIKDDLNMRGNKIINLAPAILDTDAATLGQAKSVASQTQVPTYIGETAPPNPFPGLNWYIPSEASNYVYYCDQDSCQWVQEAVASTTALIGLGMFVTPQMFGAKGGGNDDTLAFKIAQSHCEVTGDSLAIPKGDYMLTEGLKWPQNYQILGTGFGSNIMLSLTPGTYAFSEVSLFRNAWGISNLRFTIAPGASRDVGIMRLARHLRGGFINNIWSYQIDRPYLFGPQIFGNMRVTGIKCYRFVGSLSTTTAFECSSNTIMCDDIEILGDYMTGFWHKGGTVGSLTNFNISGSTGDNQMRYAIRLENVINFKLGTGWIEQLDDSFWANGAAEAVMLRNCEGVSVSEVDVASGSVYLDGGAGNDVRQIKYGQFNGGIRHKNKAVFTTDKSGMGRQSFSVSNSNGRPVQTDVPASGAGSMVQNPTLLRGLPYPFGRTNNNLVTLANNFTDFTSGESSVDVVTSSDFQGIALQAACIPGDLYTCVIKAKLVENTNYLLLANGTNTDVESKSLIVAGVEKQPVNEWQTFILSARSSGNFINFRLIIGEVDRIGGEIVGPAKFRVDAATIYKGENHFNPSLMASPDFRKGSLVINPSELLVGASTTYDVDCFGSTLIDYPEASFDQDLLGVSLQAYILEADKVRVKLTNNTSNPVDLPTGILRVRVQKN